VAQWSVQHLAKTGSRKSPTSQLHIRDLWNVEVLINIAGNVV